MDAHPRTVWALAKDDRSRTRRADPLRKLGPALSPCRMPSSLDRILLLVPPHPQACGRNLAGKGELRQVRFRSRREHSLIVQGQGTFPSANHDRRSRTLEHILQERIVLLRKTSSSLHGPPAPTTLRGLHPGRARPHHDSGATIAPELLTSPKPVRRNHDGENTSYSDRTQPRTSLKNPRDPMTRELRHQIGFRRVALGSTTASHTHHHKLRNVWPQDLVEPETLGASLYA